MRFTSLVIALAATAATACADVGPDPIAAFAGDYALTRINGAAVPTVAEQSDAGTLEIVSGSLILTVDGAYIGAVHSRWTDPSGTELQADQSVGTFFINGNGLTFRDEDGKYYAASVKADTITATYEDIILEFVKR